MKEYISLGLKGFIIGIANIIPGVSGGTLAITLGIYERLINVASHFFTNFKDNLKFLLPIIIGALLSLLLLSNVIGYCLDDYPVPTVLFFVGLILGGIPLLVRKIKGQVKSPKNCFIFVLFFLLVSSFAFVGSSNKMVSFTNLDIVGVMLLFIVGMIAAATMVIPGISGSFMLMLLGYYQPIINTIRELTHFNDIGHNLLVLLPFGIGIIIGIVLVAKLIEYLLKRFEHETYFAIIGFVLASVITILADLVGTKLFVSHIVVGLILGMIGFVIAYKLGDE